MEAGAQVLVSGYLTGTRPLRLHMKRLEDLLCGVLLTFGWELFLMVSRRFRPGLSCHLNILSNQNTLDGETWQKVFWLI